MAEDNTALFELLADTCTEYRKGDGFVRYDDDGREITEIYQMPPVPEFQAAGRVLIDCHFIVIGIDVDKAETCRAKLAALLEPQRAMLSQGPSYITIGLWLGDQSAALCLMALGEACGFWRVITPAILGFEGEPADHAAGIGYVLISSFRPEGPAQGEGEQGSDNVPGGGRMRAGGPSMQRVQELEAVTNHHAFEKAVEWLTIMDDSDDGRFHNSDGELNLTVDAAALLAASVIHLTAKSRAGDSALANLFSLRFVQHLAKLREAQDRDEGGDLPTWERDIGQVVVCPHCRAQHNAKMTVGGDGPKDMSNGDVSICITCGELGIFDDKLPGLLRLPNGMEKTLIEENPAVQAALDAWRALQKQRREMNNAVLH